MKIRIRGQCYVMINSQSRMIFLQAKPRSAKDSQKAAKKPGERHGTDYLSWSLDGTNPAYNFTFNFGFCVFETINFCCLSHPVGHTLLQQPEQTNVEGKTNSGPLHSYSR